MSSHLRTGLGEVGRENEVIDKGEGAFCTRITAVDFVCLSIFHNQNITLGFLRKSNSHEFVNILTSAVKINVDIRL